MSANDLRVALRARYAPPAYALLFEVRNGTGYQRARTRSADAVAMGLWPSRGLELEGFEIKVSRSDWLRELKDPAKADDIAVYCDRWWVVVGDKSIVQKGELPPTWGLLVPRGKALACEVEAPKLDAKPADRLFLAAMLRRANESSPAKTEIDAAVKQAREESYEKAARDQQQTTLYERREHEELCRRIAEFESASGVQIASAWNHGRIGEAVRLVMAGGVDGARQELEQMRDKLAILTRALDEQLGRTE